MKKLFLTMTLTFTTLIASAQFMIVTNINQPADDAEWEVSNFTDNMGIGYQFDDKITVGIMKNGEEYDVWGRYNINSMYVIVQAPTDSITNAANIGVGYSLNVWDKLYIEPSYSMPMKDNSGGEFKVGVAYRF